MGNPAHFILELRAAQQRGLAHRRRRFVGEHAEDDFWREPALIVRCDGASLCPLDDAGEGALRSRNQSCRVPSGPLNGHGGAFD
jgi:hypothetical protein